MRGMARCRGVGVSGAASIEKDKACSIAGLDKVADQLK
jgi:uncharacterized protein GlcG (DUF336 family)